MTSLIPEQIVDDMPQKDRLQFSSFIKKLFSRPSSALGTTIALLFLILAVFGPIIAPYNANEQIAADVQQSPSSIHFFGTDNLGRDIFSRVILGARDILLLAGSGTILSVITGTTLGLLSGYHGGWIDEVIMRIFDSFLAIPALLFALLILGTFGPSRTGVLIVLVFIYTPIVSRVVRSIVLDIKTKAFVDVARIRGESLLWILFREILPSTLPALSVEASMRFSYSIFLVSSLGFLGVGVQPPNPDWGLMVKEARTYVSQTPWALYFPAGAIAIVVIGMNLMADGLKRNLTEANS
jgi:peptide/nickel transport system permease protein